MYYYIYVVYCTCDLWYIYSVIAPFSGRGAGISSSTEENSTTRLSNSNVVWCARARARARARNRARTSTPAVLWWGPLPPLPKRHVCSRIKQRILSLLSFSWRGPIHKFTRFDITAPASPLHSDSQLIDHQQRGNAHPQSVSLTQQQPAALHQQPTCFPTTFWTRVP